MTNIAALQSSQSPLDDSREYQFRALSFRARGATGSSTAFCQSIAQRPISRELIIASFTRADVMDSCFPVNMLLYASRHGWS